MRTITFFKTLAYSLIIWFSITIVSAQKTQKIGDNPYTIDTKAVLELESTTKGFLPPRMTSAQMNAITTPTEGMIVYCTDCGINADGELRIAYNSIWQTFKGDLIGNVLGDLTGNVTATSVLVDGVTATTQTAGDNSTKVATTAFVVASLGASIEDAINDGSTAIAPSQNAVFDALALKSDLASPTFTGTPTAPTATSGDISTQIATTAFVNSTITSNSVPYTGATGAVNLGNYDLSLNNLTIGLGSGSQLTNTVVGNSALSTNISGGYSVALGYEALKSNSSGNSNTAIGYQALRLNTTGGGNSAIGFGALGKNINGGQNVAIGQSTLFNAIDASGNTVVGYSSATSVTSGGNNTILGHTNAGGLTTGSWNTIIGKGIYTGNISNNIVLGNGLGQIKAQHDGTNWTLSGTTTALGFKIPTGTASQFLKADGTVDSSTYLTSAGTATNVSGIVAVANGGTGAATLTGYVKGNGTSTMTASATIPVSDVSGAAPLASPVFTGIPTAPTATSGTNTTQIATTSFVTGAVVTSLDGLSDSKVGGTDFTNSMIIGHQTTGVLSGASDNTAVGSNSMASISSGQGNTSVGRSALASNSTGNGNTALGSNTLSSVISGTLNTAVGEYSLNQSTGSSNTAVGRSASWSNTTASFNTAIGVSALGNTNTGGNNTGLGFQALTSNTTGTGNTGLGYGANVSSSGLTNATAIGNGATVDASNKIQLGNGAVTLVSTSGALKAGAITYPNTDGTANQVLATDGSGTLAWTTPSTTATAYSGILPIANGGTGSSTQNFVDLTTNQTVAGVKTFSSNATFNGQKIGKGNATGGENLAVGAGALNGASTGVRNTAIGNSAMQNYVGTSFDNNTSIGYANLVGLTTGSGNTSVGAESMMALGTGTSNTSIGNQSLINTTGSNNIGVGKSSGSTNISGNNNTIIGTEANVGANNLSNATALGYGAVVATSNTIQLGDTSVTNVKTSGTLTAGTVTYPNTHNATAGQVLTTNASGVASWQNSITEIADEYTNTTGVGSQYLTAGETSFTLTQAPSANCKVKMYINGIRISNTAYSVSGSTLTYVPANNGGYTITLSDRIQFDYFY